MWCEVGTTSGAYGGYRFTVLTAVFTVDEELLLLTNVTVPS
jgi:hypothetical protein